MEGEQLSQPGEPGPLRSYLASLPDFAIRQCLDAGIVRLEDPRRNSDGASPWVLRDLLASAWLREYCGDGKREEDARELLRFRIIALFGHEPRASASVVQSSLLLKNCRSSPEASDSEWSDDDDDVAEVPRGGVVGGAKGPDSSASFDLSASLIDNDTGDGMAPRAASPSAAGPHASPSPPGTPSKLVASGLSHSRRRPPPLPAPFLLGAAEPALEVGKKRKRSPRPSVPIGQRRLPVPDSRLILANLVSDSSLGRLTSDSCTSEDERVDSLRPLDEAPESSRQQPCMGTPEDAISHPGTPDRSGPAECHPAAGLSKPKPLFVEGNPVLQQFFRTPSPSSKLGGPSRSLPVSLRVTRASLRKPLNLEE